MMNKYQKLHALSEWACLAYSEHMVLPAKTIYLLAGEARRLLAERDRLLGEIEAFKNERTHREIKEGG